MTFFLVKYKFSIFNLVGIVCNKRINVEEDTVLRWNIRVFYLHIIYSSIDKGIIFYRFSKRETRFLILRKLIQWYLKSAAVAGWPIQVNILSSWNSLSIINKRINCTLEKRRRPPENMHETHHKCEFIIK